MQVTLIPSSQFDVTQPIFDSFRQDYAGFDSWFATKVSSQPLRQCLALLDENSNYTAVAIVKQNEAAGTHGLLGELSKLCTFKVAQELTGEFRGTTLLAAVEQLMGENRTLFVEVLPKYVGVVNFFTKNGFHQVPNASTVRGELVLAKSYPHSSG